MNLIPATELGRNSRVLRNTDPMPYLVDSVNDLPDGGVTVTYSSGDVVTYTSTQMVEVF